ncbi:UvrD-helicase domain-containing protein [Fodinicola acaciae]|uniref:UvrD-helicase domain-containing protein n=1 Tax=Fodinicola acaciae TaxID=2681555 RepID=UPI0013D651DC|nr:UvrD-helicase domain-containing protein [Fodinicola acaciae]
MTARLSLYQKAEQELYKLDRTVKAKFYDFCHLFRDNPDHPGLDLKPLKGDKRVFRAKVDQSYRALLAKTGIDADGQESWLVIAVRHRRHVYEELSVAINRITGEIEFVDLAVVGGSILQRAGITLTPTEPEGEVHTESVPSLQVSTKSVPLLADVTAADLRALGVNDQLIDLALTVTDSDELYQLVDGAPLLSKDVLIGLGAGMSIAEVRKEITAPVEIEFDKDDTENLAAALSRTTVTTVDKDIKSVLEEGDFRAWKVFLHPTQAKLISRNYNGPARVSGGPGTGKTIVALHRVKHLAEQLPPGPGMPILLTTFTKNLTTDLRARLASLLEPDLLARVEITHIDQLAARVLSENATGSSRQRIYDTVALDHLRNLLAETGPSRWSPTFLLEEWDQVILGQSLSNRRGYFEARRAGRGRSLTRPERHQIWTLLEQFTARLEKDGLETWGQAAERAARLEMERARKIEERRTHSAAGDRRSVDDDSSSVQYADYRYRHVVVDEAQDLRAAHWKMLRAMVPQTSSDLFIAGDTHQRIYDHQVTLSTVGISIRGRSSRLTLSYRTTREILARVVGIVAPEQISYDNLDDGTDTLDGYRSVLHGSAPEFVGFDSLDDELAELAGALRRWREEISNASDGTRLDPRGTMAVCVPDRDTAAKVVHYLSAKAGITCAELTKDGPKGDGEVHVGTMHRFKGLEYQKLAIVAARDGLIPRAGLIESYRKEDPQRYAREERKARSLLFVAATRARDTLRISWHGKPSPYLPV